MEASQSTNLNKDLFQTTGSFEDKRKWEDFNLVKPTSSSTYKSSESDFYY